MTTTTEIARTHSTVALNSFTWSIDNFILRDEDLGNILTSPVFPQGDHNKLTWKLELYPKGCDNQSKDYVSLFIRVVSWGRPIKPKVRAKVNLTIVDIEGNSATTKNMSFLHTFRPLSDKDGRGYPQFLKRDALSNPNLLVNGALRLHCMIRYLTDTKTTIQAGPELSPELADVKLPTCQLASNLEELLISGDFSDVVFKIGDREIKAHKNVLAARSPVFSAMFKSGMTEANESIVDIEDIRHETFHQMLRYIYSGKLPKTDDITNELFEAADKYSLDRLKSSCEHNLCLNISDDNAVDIFVLACLHNSTQLKDFVIKYIVNHADKIVGSETWNTMFTSHPFFFLDIVNALAKVAEPIEPFIKKIKMQTQ